MFWLCLAALYLAGVPVTLFLMATVGLVDEDDIVDASPSDIVLFVLFWPLVVIFFVSCLSMLAGEKLNSAFKRRRGDR